MYGVSKPNREQGEGEVLKLSDVVICLASALGVDVLVGDAPWVASTQASETILDRRGSG